MVVVFKRAPRVVHGRLVGQGFLQCCRALAQVGFRFDRDTNRLHIHAIQPNIRRLVGREDRGLGAFDPAAGDFFAIDQDRGRSALADPTAIIVEVHADGGLARSHRLRSCDLVFLHADKVVAVGRLAVLEI